MAVFRGRRRLDWPTIRTRKVELIVTLFQAEAAFVHQRVVMRTKQNHVAQVCFASITPVLDVVGI